MMEHGFSILMFFFAGALLLYAGLMALTKDYKMLPYRARQSVKPKNSEKYMVQLAKMGTIREKNCMPAGLGNIDRYAIWKNAD